MTGPEEVDLAYRDHASGVFRVALAIVRDREAALEITQESFLRALLSWDSIDHAQPLSRWLNAVAANLAIDSTRRRHRLLGVGGVLYRVIDGQRAHHAERDQLRTVIDRELLDEALGQLTIAERALLILRYYLGYDYSELATIFRTSTGTIGSRLTRTHQKLHRTLGDGAPAASSRGLHGRTRDGRS